MALTLDRAQTHPQSRRSQLSQLSLASALAQPDARWLLAAAAVVVLLCALPYVVSAMFGPPQMDHLGTFWFVRDFSQYQAAMREGAAQAGWLIHDHFSAEPHQAAFIYPLYTAAGKVASALHVDALAVFSALEWLGRVALLVALFVFTATFLEDRRARRLALVLAAGSLGLIGLVAPLRAVLAVLGFGAAADALPSTINVYLELSSFGVFLSAPHLMFGLALTLLCAPLYLARRPVWLALVVFALSLLHPFNLPVLVSVLVVHAACSGRRWWALAVVAVAASAPILVYNLWLFTTDPFWSGTYGTQNLMPAPAPWALPVDLGVVLLAAPLAWPVLRTWSADRRRLLLLWVGLALAWLYVPVPYQRRFALGIQPALAVAAAVGLLALNDRLRSRTVNHRGPLLALRARLLSYMVALATAATPVLVYVALIGSAVSNFPAEVYLWTRPETEAAAWLRDHSTAADVVLASTEFANPLVGAIDGRVVHGHIVATLHSSEKQALVRRFFAPDVGVAERSELLVRSGATLVAFGPHERMLGSSELQRQPELELLYDRGGVEVFRVRR